MAYTRIVPLGGLGEVGMNCLALETAQGILVIDCGVTFPHREPGVDVIHPDFRYLWDRREQVLGVVITHGHEDHIGALPYLLRQIPLPVWAPPYAATLVRARLAEHPEVPPVDLRVTTPRERFTVGPFGIEPLRVTHSIPDSTALAIDTPAGRIFHTGDFKFEDQPLDDQPSDEARFRELGDDGVAVLLSDSTNIDVPGRAARERDVGRALADIVRAERGRVIVGVFASNVFRLQSLADVAQETGRKLVLLGRSVQNHVRAATDLGRLRMRSDLVMPPDLALTLPPHQVLAIAGGTQAESSSAIARLARGDHPKLRVDRGDAVIFSSRAIPGNERDVFDLVCALERRGATVHFRTSEGEIHASGHAGRAEQTRMIELIRPRAFIPVHGAFHHLKRHAELAASLDVHEVSVLENGQTARWSGEGLTRGDAVPHGRVHVDGGQELSRATLDERTVLADAGVVMATIMVNERGGLVGTPQVSTRGVVLEDSDDVVRSAAEVAIEEALRIARGPLDALSGEGARDAARAALRRIYKVAQKRPTVIVHVTRVLDA